MSKYVWSADLIAFLATMVVMGLLILAVVLHG